MISMNNFFKISTLVFSLSITGCASIISGSTQTLSFKSVPEASQISITNRKGEKVHIGQTPVTVTLNKSAGYFKGEIYNITFTKEGFQPKTIEVKAKVSGWYFGNIVFGGFGLIGVLIVDPATGAMYTLTPKDVSAVLDQEGLVATDKTLIVRLKQDISQSIMARAIEIK